MLNKLVQQWQTLLVFWFLNRFVQEWLNLTASRVPEQFGSGMANQTLAPDPWTLLPTRLRYAKTLRLAAERISITSTPFSKTEQVARCLHTPCHWFPSGERSPSFSTSHLFRRAIEKVVGELCSPVLNSKHSEPNAIGKARLYRAACLPLYGMRHKD